MKTAWSEIEKAQRFLGNYFKPTRLVLAESLSRPQVPVYLKLETELPTGSFKVRGAMFALHTQMESHEVREVVAASTGNHGAAVAYAAKRLGAAATIFLPSQSNPVKRKRIQELGARIVEDGKDISEALERAQAYAARTGAFVLNDASDLNVPAGTATIGCEILQQLPDVEAIWVPMGTPLSSAELHLRPNISEATCGSSASRPNSLQPTISPGSEALLLLQIHVTPSPTGWPLGMQSKRT